MKVAVDISPLNSGHKVRGIGFHLSQLQEAIERRKSKDIDIDFVDFYSTDLSKYDLVHYPYFFPYFDTFPKLEEVKKYSVTIHDLIQLVYPDKYPAGIGGKINFRKQKSKVQSAEGILTISETSKKDICRFLGLQPDKVTVVHLAAKASLHEAKTDVVSKVTKKYKLPDKFVLYVGDVNFNKNIPNLIKACALAGVHLVIVGKHAEKLDDALLNLPTINGPRDWLRFLTNTPHPEIAHYLNIKAEIENHKDVTITGFVSDEEQMAIYSKATLYCQPSYYEGFGLNPLEAQKCNTPVVAAKTQALVEVLGQSALYFNPSDPQNMALVIKKIYKDKSLQKDYAKRGKANADSYTWDKTAKETIDFFRQNLK